MIFSRHAQSRFKERFPEYMSSPESTLQSIHSAFNAATETKCFINNTAFLVYLMEKYGDYNLSFFVNGKLLFVCSGPMVKTVMSLDHPQTAKVHGHATNKRFKKKAAVA